jgi:ABC-2 type transport system permease protein
MFGGLLNLPDWVLELSPFAHTAAMPLADLPFAPLAVLTAVAAVLAIAGSTASRRRDLELV